MFPKPRPTSPQIRAMVVALLAGFEFRQRVREQKRLAQKMARSTK
jgi:hypothetical protein